MSWVIVPVCEGDGPSSSSSAMCPISRAEAKERGLVRYYTGKPCKHGHVVERMVVNSDCVRCLRLRFLRIQKARRVEFNERVREWHRNNPGKSMEYYRKRFESDPDGFRAKTRARVAKNPAPSRLAKSAWKKRNPDAVTEAENCRRAREREAFPKWVDREEIKVVYKQCRVVSRETGITHHVDHIVPLINPIVCGLHVPWNLRIVPATENYAKNNRLITSYDACNAETQHPPLHLVSLL